MMHDISWKIYLLKSSQEIQQQFVIQIGLISTSSLPKEALVNKLQKHPVLNIHVNQLGCRISSQQQICVALQQRIFPADVPLEPS